MRIIILFLALLVLTGCTCSHLHVPGRDWNHPEPATTEDAIFCTIDYLLFPPEN